MSGRPILLAVPNVSEGRDAPTIEAIGAAFAPARLLEGGPAGLAERLEGGELVPDYGPPRAHPSAGAVLVTARPPLIAFNLELAAATHDEAREIAASLRESSPGGLPGVRAIGLALA